MRDGHPPELQALEARIARTLERIYGDASNDLERYISATKLHYSRIVWTSSMPDTTIGEYRDHTRNKIHAAVITLESAIGTLLEDTSELFDQVSVAGESDIKKDLVSRKAFVVHGRDDATRESVARFLMKIEVQPIILHEQANRGQTVVEKIYAYSDVDFAVVILTPDDVGRLKGGEQKPRVRQNVMLELGFFLGKLGREKVCALKHGEIDIPTDFAGTV